MAVPEWRTTDTKHSTVVTSRYAQNPCCGHFESNGDISPTELLLGKLQLQRCFHFHWHTIQQIRFILPCSDGFDDRNNEGIGSVHLLGLVNIPILINTQSENDCAFHGLRP